MISFSKDLKIAFRQTTCCDLNRRLAGHGFLLALAALLLYGAGTGQIPLIDRDEPRFAQATVEMMERQEWIVPYFNGDYRFDKPVLSYWLIRMGYALLGRSEFGARPQAVLCTFLVVVSIYATGCRWFCSAR